MHASRTIEDCAEPVALSRLIAGVAEELRRLGTSVDGLQATLSPHLLKLASRDLRLATDVQELDRLGQTLDALALYLGELAHVCPAAHVAGSAEMLGRLPLHDLARRLGGETAVEEDDGFELF